MQKMERATGVEPASEAWEASILPMNYARMTRMRLYQMDREVAPPEARTQSPHPKPAFRAACTEPDCTEPDCTEPEPAVRRGFGAPAL